jgi:putative SOS response-associated peptidase YedK
MCYETSQLAEKLYREAIRLGASTDEIDRLKFKWEQLKAEHGNYYHANGFLHPKLALFCSNKNQIDIKYCVWGLIPNWTKDEKFASQIWNRTINARGESIFEKPSFKMAAYKGRCILPLDGFFEHHHKNGKAFPYFIKAKNKKRMLIGAIKDSWTNKSTGEILDSFSIVTTPGNTLLRTIHNNPKLEGPRMPLILNEEDSTQWLNGNSNEAIALLKPNQTIDLSAHTVQKLKGSFYLGNQESVQDEYFYSELNSNPELFD